MDSFNDAAAAANVPQQREAANAQNKNILHGGGGRLPFMSADPNQVFEDSESDDDKDESDHGDGEDSVPDSESKPETQVLPSQNVHGERPQKRLRKTPVPRVVVNELHIVSLVKAYRIEFAAFCRGKKQAPKQIIPGKVWEKVYHNHCLPDFPRSEFEEDTLKKHLREHLAELDTDIAYDGQRPVLQDEQIANEVRATDCDATKNILQRQQSFIGGVSSHDISPASTLGTSTPPTVSLAPVTPAVPVRTSDVPVAEPDRAVPTASTSTGAATSRVESPRLTKFEMLQIQADAICSIAKNLLNAAEKHASLMDAKTTKHKVALLKEAKKYGIINKEEFKVKLKELLKF